MKTAGMSFAGLAILPSNASPAEDNQLKEARYYEKLDDNKIKCTLCPWNCVVEKGERGLCEVRENKGGKYYSLVYGHPCSINVDPIEKKPFFHVYPGSTAFSLATVGCNIDCKFCQNWEIAQTNPDNIQTRYVPPEDIAEMASKSGARTVAYTYSEPTIFFEYMTDCARAAKDKKLGNVMVSNGFISEEPLKKLCDLMTAIKVDLKAFTEKFYRETCAGQLQPVLNTLKRIADSGTWLEIVVLIIPTLNDGMDEIKRMSAWIVKELGPNVPLHFTRFHPAYKMRNLPPTPIKTLHSAREKAMEEGCRFVYTGNMPGGEGENTFCPKCKTLLLDRYGHAIIEDFIKTGKCHKCGTKIPGIWNI